MKYKYILNELDCANCANKIERKLNENEEIDKAIVNFNKLTVTVYTKKDKGVKELVEKIVAEIEPDVKVLESDDNNKKNNTKLEVLRLTLGIILTLLGMFLFKGIVGDILIITSYIILLYKVIIKAFKLLIKKSIDENLLITISCIGAYFTNNIHEGLMVIILYDIGKVLEGIAVNNSRKSIKELMNIKPEYANLVTEEDTLVVEPSKVKVGDTIMIKPGEKIPLDGIVTKGSTKLNTASITGESKLLKVDVGDKVISGTINTSNLIYLEVTNKYEDSTVAKILTLLDDATDRKAKVETTVNKAAKIYTPIVLVLAVLTVIFLLLTHDISFNDALYRGLTFLVISCPCAIAISVPLSYFSGIGKCSKEGILIKGSDYLDEISNIKEIIFDKTGTISTGEFTDYELILLDNKYQDEDIINYYVTGESLSNHPLAKSIIKIFNKKSTLTVKDFKEISGKGISFKVDKKTILIGSAVFCKSDFSDEAIYLNIDNENVAKLILKDSIRSDAKGMIKGLKELGITPKMYTGDSKNYALDIASKVGIEDVLYELLPQDKYKLLQEELKNNKDIAFVGDGINDAPAISLATVGISLGGIGSDAAIEASDIVIMNDKLDSIIKCIDISKYTKKVIKENLIFAIGVKILVLILCALGIASMWQAVFADTGVTLLTIINTMKILRRRQS